MLPRARSLTEQCVRALRILGRVEMLGFGLVCEVFRRTLGHLEQRSQSTASSIERSEASIQPLARQIEALCEVF